MTTPESFSRVRSPAALWLPPFFMMALIFILSSSVLPRFQVPIPHPDKVAHLVVYGVLGFLLGRAAGGNWGWSWKRAALFAVVVSSIYGASDEWHQSFIPGRSVDAVDWAADTIGAALAQVPLYFLRARKAGRRDN